MDQRRKNKKMDMIPHYISPFSLTLSSSPTGNSISHLVVLISYLAGLYLHAVLKYISWYTHLNWISLPVSKTSTYCCAHLLSFTFFFFYFFFHNVEHKHKWLRHGLLSTSPKFCNCVTVTSGIKRIMLLWMLPLRYWNAYYFILS